MMGKYTDRDAVMSRYTDRNAMMNKHEHKHTNDKKVVIYMNVKYIKYKSAHCLQT